MRHNGPHGAEGMDGRRERADATDAKTGPLAGVFGGTERTRGTGARFGRVPCPRSPPGEGSVLWFPPSSPVFPAGLPPPGGLSRGGGRGKIFNPDGGV